MSQGSKIQIIVAIIGAIAVIVAAVISNSDINISFNNTISNDKIPNLTVETNDSKKDYQDQATPSVEPGPKIENSHARKALISDIQGVPLRLYYKDSPSKLVVRLASDLLNKGMMNVKVEDTLGINGAKSIAYKPEYKYGALWLKENVKQFSDFKMIENCNKCTGIIVNMW